MKKIRTRLLIHFCVILMFVLIISYVQNQSHDKVFDLYDQSTDRFFLLNEISLKTNDAIQSLHIYVLEPLPENLSFFQKSIEELSTLQEQFKSKQGYNNVIETKNYQHIITSFIDASEFTVAEVQDRNIEQYSMFLNEAETFSHYIHEMTQDLINDELTSYQKEYDLVKEKIAYTKKMGTSIFISVIILSILFAYWFSNGITSTIGRLTRVAEEISAGKYSGEDVQVSTKDELAFLTKTFNQMKKNINQSVHKIEERSRLDQLLKEMELRSLQNQINPHFLFNTLNSISQTAYIEGAEKTSDLITSVSALLRYNLGELDRPIVLADEVKIVKEYFYIQSTRFGDRVTFYQEIDPACLDVPIPCLTLQPIVENAFIHGIEEMTEGAKIQLRIYHDGEFIYIKVTDNGAGMDEETMDRILNPREKQIGQAKKGSGHSNGIGIGNVITRLQLFDKGSKLSIQSTIGKGTTFTIQLSRNRTNSNGS